MKSILLSIILFFVFITNNIAQETLSDSGYVKGELLIQTSSNQNLNLILRKCKSLNGFETELKLKAIPAPDLGIYLCSFNNSKVDHAEILNHLRTMPEVILAQNNHYIQNRATPDDPQFGTMWGLNNTGQSGGTVDADIDAPEAWEISTGGLSSSGDTIVVAVIDGGFYLAHQDITFWKNYNEIPGDTIDNDGNGYVDDVNGWNAYNNSGNISSDSHGTHVSGTVGAKGNNATGVVGVNWNVKVMGVMGSSETESVVVNAYNYILKQRKIYNRTNGDSGAFVVSTNASFGKDYGQPVNFPIWCAVYDSLGKAGILSCGATANRNLDVDVQGDIPTACTSPYLISVTNTTRADVKYTGGAAWGLNSIDLGAPGSSIMSTYPSNTYSTSTGTSMATPHVAGAIGLMFSAASVGLINQYKQKPDSIALVMKDWLLCSTDPLNDLNGKTLTGGRLNIFNALNKVTAETACLVSNNDIENAPIKSILYTFGPNPVLSNWINISYYLSGNFNYSAVIYNAQGQKVNETVLKNSGKGFHNQKLSLPELNAGTYFVKIIGNGEETNIQKLLIIK